jgi:hypothetical protein
VELRCVGALSMSGFSLEKPMASNSGMVISL